jgi:2-oxoglutarate ferredoxin oxidoreductase subunit delta
MGQRKAHEIRVNEVWCKQCGICIAFCAPAALKADVTGAPQVVNLEACTLCMLCELRCPDFAIEVIAESPRQDKEVAVRDAAAAAHAG